MPRLAPPPPALVALGGLLLAALMLALGGFVPDPFVLGLAAFVVVPFGILAASVRQLPGVVGWLLLLVPLLAGLGMLVAVFTDTHSTAALGLLWFPPGGLILLAAVAAAKAAAARGGHGLTP